MSSAWDVLEYNSYGFVTAESCKKTGLPMFGNPNYKEWDYNEYVNKWLSKTRCKKIKKPVTEGEEPVAFLLAYNGYAPLYDRSKYCEEV